jgi:hypothetical protein
VNVERLKIQKNINEDNDRFFFKYNGVEKQIKL